MNIEVQSRTFEGVEKISGYEEGKKLLIYWKLTLMVCDHWLQWIYDHTNTHEGAWLQEYRESFLFYG